MPIPRTTEPHRAGLLVKRDKNPKPAENVVARYGACIAIMANVTSYPFCRAPEFPFKKWRPAPLPTTPEVVTAASL